ncbi:hypothetical protein [Archangium lansingense]|uniref:Immunity protein 49 of polymorphic toxin system n=1 Tax=Archangium lansingense TaxID=2995310 RepID=A0ABT3ZZ38_9BACT|nr:hypothetical protein [Archangium lansinium]MCY1074004.1 hypothetical protein [Archangium lansinium]
MRKNPTRLEALRANTISLLEEALQSIQARDVREYHGLSYFEAAYMYRRLALCDMLKDARADRFHVFLRKSALVRLHFLRLVAQGHATQPLYVCGSENRSLVDALATGEFGLAADIASVSTDRHTPSLEYEDDFLLYEFLRRSALALKSGDWSSLPGLLPRWEQVLEGGEDPYLDVCRALLARDPKAFHGALLTVITDRELRFREVTEESGPNADLRWTEGPVFLNGLAFLRIAERLELPTEPEYPTIPRLARLEMTLPTLRPDAWMDWSANVPA